MADQAKSGQLSGNVVLYKQPEPLNVEQHSKLGLKNDQSGFAYAKTTHFVPLTVEEFAIASTTFPIIFAGDKYQPLAVMGLRENENLFVNDDNTFKQDSYVPSFLRRYPFVFANQDNSDQLVVCIDRAYSAIQENPDAPFFEDGEMSEYTKNCVEFLKAFETSRLNTEAVVKRLLELDVFTKRDVMFNPATRRMQGEPVKVTDHYAIDENKVRELDADVLKELAGNGILGAMYAHMISLNNWERLFDMGLRRGAATNPQDAKLNTDKAADNT